MQVQEFAEIDRLAEAEADKRGRRPDVDAVHAAIFTAIGVLTLLMAFAGLIGAHGQTVGLAAFALTALAAGIVYAALRSQKKRWSERYHAALKQLIEDRCAAEERRRRLELATRRRVEMATPAPATPAPAGMCQPLKLVSDNPTPSKSAPLLERVSDNSTPTPWPYGQCLMTPAQHRTRAAQLRARGTPEALELATQHDNVAQMIERRHPSAFSS